MFHGKWASVSRLMALLGLGIFFYLIKLYSFFQVHPQVPQTQPQPSAFRSIHQVAPGECQPVIFVPVHNQHPQPLSQQQKQRHKGGTNQFRPAVSTRHSTRGAASRPSKSVGHSQQLAELIKLAKSTENLTARIHKRQINVVARHCSARDKVI